MPLSRFPVGGSAPADASDTVKGIVELATLAEMTSGTDAVRAATPQGVRQEINTRAASSHSHAQSDITNLTTDLAAKAPIASPTFTGTPSAPTASGGTNTTQLATTAFVTSAVSGKANTSHTHAQSDITNLTTDLAGKANTSHTHAQSDITNLTTDLSAKAPLASPALTGTPTAPTASAGTNTTQLATTAFVTGAFTTRMDSASIKIITQAAYTALGSKDANTVYFIVG